jgi:hypothetical protein
MTTRKKKKVPMEAPPFVQITCGATGSPSVERLYGLDANGRVWEWWLGVPGASEGWEILSNEVLPEQS